MSNYNPNIVNNMLIHYSGLMNINVRFLGYVTYF